MKELLGTTSKKTLSAIAGNEFQNIKGRSSSDRPLMFLLWKSNQEVVVEIRVVLIFNTIFGRH